MAKNKKEVFKMTKKVEGKESIVLSNDGNVIERLREIYLVCGKCLDIYDVTEVRIGKTSLRIKGSIKGYVDGCLTMIPVYHIIYIDKINYMRISPTEDMVVLK